MSSPYLRTSANSAPPATVYSYQKPVGTSFLVHAGLATGTWLVGVGTNRLDYKDWLWPTAPVANAWYQAVGIPVYHYGVPIGVALSGLTWRQSLMLGGVTTWGVRLFYQMSTTAVKRGHDDVRYTKDKLEPAFWGKSLFKTYLPAALFQVLITLPVVAPLRVHRVALDAWGWTDTLAVAAFAAGFTLETFADAQRRAAKKHGANRLYRDGVWSIVRHPNYLGDALTQLSFALLAMNTPAYNPFLFAGPLANYLYLRYFAGDAVEEPAAAERYSQFDPAKDAALARYQREKNAFWPAPSEYSNVWTWAVVAAGVLGVAAEKGLRTFVRPAVL